VASGFIGRKTNPLKARPGDHKPEENPEANKTGKRREEEISVELGRRLSRKKRTKSNRQIYPIFRPPLTSG
jgi:hypothetical protein